VRSRSRVNTQIGKAPYMGPQWAKFGRTAAVFWVRTDSAVLAALKRALAPKVPIVWKWTISSRRLFLAAIAPRKRSNSVLFKSMISMNIKNSIKLYKINNKRK